MAHAGVRLIAWITSLAAILMLAFVCKEWSSKSQVIIAGVVGVSNPSLQCLRLRKTDVL